MVKYVLVGEIHGTQESAPVALLLLKKHEIKILALELDNTKQHEIDEYMHGKRRIDNISLFQHTAPHDGRASTAVKKLIEQAKKQKIKVVLVDDERDPLERDKYMAKNLMRLRKNVLFLCGNAHASKQPITFSHAHRWFNGILALFGAPHLLLPPNGVMKTCGSYLPSKDTIAYNIVPVYGGQYYNFKTHTLRPNKSLIKNKLHLPAIIKSEKKYDFVYAIKRISPSI